MTAYNQHLNNRIGEVKELAKACGMHAQISFDALNTVVQDTFYSGDKFIGGYGETRIVIPDYWTMRARSNELFNTNLYARGLIRRLITNEIATGLNLESIPEEKILGLKEDELNDWSEDNENRFHLWAKTSHLCDYHEQSTFAEITRTVRRESLIDGDILVVAHVDSATKLPKIQLISGGSVVSPNFVRYQGREIKHGVEVNPNGKHIAYWVLQDDGTVKRIPAWGSMNRRLAWLVYGTDRRKDQVRGYPLLSIVFQSLKELDRYRDASQRKQVINSILAMFIKRTTPAPMTMPLTGGAMRRDLVQVNGAAGADEKRIQLNGYVPGMVIERLENGEEPVAFNEQANSSFVPFEAAIVHAIAWACEIPPEILTLAFTDNYSASQAAINEFKIYLNFIRSYLGECFCEPIYHEFFIGSVLSGKIKAKGFLESLVDPRLYDIRAAWLSSEWSGAIKPSTDVLKQAKGYQMLVDHGWITNDRASRELTGTKWSKNIKRVLKENELKAKARLILEPPEQKMENKLVVLQNHIDALLDIFENQD